MEKQAPVWLLRMGWSRGAGLVSTRLRSQSGVNDERGWEPGGLYCAPRAVARAATFPGSLSSWNDCRTDGPRMECCAARHLLAMPAAWSEGLAWGTRSRRALELQRSLLAWCCMVKLFSFGSQSLRWQSSGFSTTGWQSVPCSTSLT
jgi:hypothetical protein